jgi:hypothetical protein
MVAGPIGEPYGVLDDSGSLIAVYRRVGERAEPEVVLPS